MNSKLIKLFAAFLSLVLVSAASTAAGKKPAPQNTDRPNAHGSQGTGSWKGKRDGNQKAGPQHEKKKQAGRKWIHKKP